MRKFLSMLVMLVIAAPAMAAVTITVTDGADGNTAVIGYVADAAVSGFGLDITVTGANIIAVDPDHRGEGAGFGIFPASFHREVNPLAPDYSAPYTPVALYGTDPGAAGVLGGPAVTVEMGALYETTGPTLSGDLFTITTDGCGTIVVTENATRGGIVYEDTNDADLAGGTGEITGCDVCCGGDLDDDDDIDLDDYYGIQGLLFYADYYVSGGLGTDYLVTPGHANANVAALWNECGDLDGDDDIDLDDYYGVQGLLFYADYYISGGLGTDYLVTPGHANANVAALWPCP